MTFQTEHPVIHHWLVSNATTSSFARGLLKRIGRFGSISEAQAARAMSMALRGQQRQRQRQLGRTKRSLKARDIIAMTMPVEPRDD